MSNKYWGYHLAIDAPNANLEFIKDSKRISNFAKDLVKRIDMVAYGEPVVVHFGSGNKAGYTMFQLIETSNICAHFVESDGNGTGSYYLDVFSCKPFDQKTVVDCAREYFGNTTEITHYMNRDAYKIEDVLVKETTTPKKDTAKTTLEKNKKPSTNEDIAYYINKAIKDQ